MFCTIVSSDIDFFNVLLAEEPKIQKCICHDLTVYNSNMHIVITSDIFYSNLNT
jgi:hypothetical protein